MDCDISDFHTIEKLFNLIDSPEFPERDVNQISSIFRQFCDLAKRDGREIEVKLSEWNMAFLDFSINENKLHPKASGLSENNTIWEYPSLSRFDETAFQHLKDRSVKTKNPLLKMRYNHLLWLSPHKHKKYAIEAINNYLLLIQELTSNKSIEPHPLGIQLAQYLINTFLLAKQTNYHTVEVTEQITVALFDRHMHLNIRYRLFQYLLPLIKKEKKYFSALDPAKLNSDLWLMVDSFINNPIVQIDLLRFGIVYFSQKDVICGYHEKLGETYERLVSKKGDDLLSIDYVQKAILCFKKSGNKQKVFELEKVQKELIKTMPLGQVEIPFDLRKIQKEIESEAKKISGYKAEEIIHYLIYNKSILSQKGPLQAEAKTWIAKTPIFAAFNMGFLDTRGNLVKNLTVNDKDYEIMMKDYSLYLDHCYAPLIHRIIYLSVIKNKISAEYIAKHFVDNTWIGKELSQTVANNSTTYNWLSAIMPPIYSYFYKLRYLEYSNLSFNYIQEIDSLTLKIEGVLRDFLNLQGIVTFKNSEDRNGNIVSQEKNLTELLGDENLLRLFGEDDILFLRFLLTDKIGYNLRNAVAHSLMLPQHYSVGLMHLLLVAILRIGRYDIKITYTDPIQV